MLTIAWEYLTGRCVASDVTERERPEWPPHPDRVYQSLVAAWGEGGQDAEEKGALVWLATLPPPDIITPELLVSTGDDPVGDAPCATIGASPKSYVPANDVGGRAKPSLASLPSERPRKERHFPSVYVGSEACALVWPGVESAEHVAALGRLATKVSRIGHSSSLVRCWVPTNPVGTPRFVPVPGAQRGGLALRVASAGRLDELEKDFGDGDGSWVRPRGARWVDYREALPDGVTAGPFAAQLIVFRRVSGTMSLPGMLTYASALRATLMKHATANAMPCISGHDPSGQASTAPHAAYLPLPFVEHPYADGHLLGLAIALPAGLPFEVEEGVYRAAALAMDPETEVLTLRLGSAGTVGLVAETRPLPPYALRSRTWTRPVRRFLSVSPVVLDRQVPRRVRDRDAFVEDEMRRMCQRAGYPVPTEVALSDVGYLKGTPPAWEFPALPSKAGGARRHTHVALTFEEPLVGPVTIGAGRFRGYGLMKPVSGDGE